MCPLCQLLDCAGYTYNLLSFLSISIKAYRFIFEQLFEAFQKVLCVTEELGSMQYFFVIIIIIMYSFSLFNLFGEKINKKNIKLKHTNSEYYIIIYI